MDGEGEATSRDHAAAGHSVHRACGVAALLDTDPQVAAIMAAALVEAHMVCDGC